jgi:flagellar assembly factor FliW
MRKDVSKIIVIVLFGCGILVFKSIKTSITQQISKCVSLLNSNSQDRLSFNY